MPGGGIPGPIEALRWIARFDIAPGNGGGGACVLRSSILTRYEDGREANDEPGAPERRRRIYQDVETLYSAEAGPLGGSPPGCAGAASVCCPRLDRVCPGCHARRGGGSGDR